MVWLIILSDDDIQILSGDLASDVNLGVILVDEHQLFALVVNAPGQVPGGVAIQDLSGDRDH